MSELDHGSKVPDTMTFTEEERALARQKQQEADAAKKKRRNRLIASVAGGATLIGGGVVAAFGMGGESNPTPERNPAASATPTPGPTETSVPTPTEAPSPTNPTETEVPAVIDDAYVETVTRDPSPEVMAYALEELDAKKYTAEEAAIHHMNSLKLLWISGESAMKTEVDNVDETPESTAEREAIMTSIFGDKSVRTKDLEDLPLDWVVRVRGLLALQLDYVTTDNGFEENGTFNSTTRIIHPVGDNDPTAQSFRIEDTWQSNIQQLDTTYTDGTTWPESITERTITERVVDGRWVVSELKDFKTIKEVQVDAS